MKKDLVTITAVALGTAALTVATFSGRHLQAGNQEPPMNPINRAPSFTADGLKMTLQLREGRTFKAGEQPEFELKAVNTRDQSSSTRVCVTLSATSRPSMFSRTLAMPMCLWQEQRLLNLNAGETRVFAFSAATNLPANSDLTVWLSPAQQQESPGPQAVLSSRSPLAPFPVGGTPVLTFSTVPSQASSAYAVAR